MHKYEGLDIIYFSSHYKTNIFNPKKPHDRYETQRFNRPTLLRQPPNRPYPELDDSNPHPHIST
jgi:hypothetical protein